MILITICARAGSKGIKNKNIQNLMGKPLIQHTIEHAKEWGKASQIVISTDSQEIKEISESLSVSVPFIRPDDLGSDTAGKLSVIKHALHESESYFQTTFDTVIDLDVTAPLRTTTDIDNAYKLLKEQQLDVVFSVAEAHRNPYFNMVETKENEKGVFLSKQLEGAVLRRQDAPRVYSMNASIYVYRSEFLKDNTNATIFGKNTGIYEMPEESVFDIDRPIDLKLVEFFMKERISNASSK